nr:hypothetical protein StreXyl84_15050 [Streptomyces sp. Xyl84]
MPLVAQGELDCLAHGGVVFDEQDPGHVAQYVRTANGAGRGGRPRGELLRKDHMSTALTPRTTAVTVL